MAEYMHEELTDMHLTYDEAKEDGCEARRLYEQRFPMQDVREMYEHQKWKSEFRQDLKHFFPQSRKRWLTKSVFLSE